MRHDVYNGIPIGQPYTLPRRVYGGVLNAGSGAEFLEEHGSYPCVIESVESPEESGTSFVDGIVTVRRYTEPPANPLAGYENEAYAFQVLWAETGIETIPDSWLDAIQLLEDADVPQVTINKLLALRLALAPVWDVILEMGAE